MKILALEFSSAQRSVAVLAGARESRGGALSSAGMLEAEVIQTGGRATEAFGMIETALRQAQLEREQIECVAVGLGPGSYNGIRVAIALAEGWQLARDVKLLGISTAECIAAQARADGLMGLVAVVIDAQRGEFYVANYELDAAGWRETQPLRLASPEKVEQCRATGNLLIGPDVTKWFPSSRTVYPGAATLARLGAGRTTFVSGQALTPIYLRETAFVKAPLPRVLPP